MSPLFFAILGLVAGLAACLGLVIHLLDHPL